ncbi:serine protease, partial [Staphylococcus haemolyticus]
MNNILRLKGTLNYKKNSSKMGNRNLPKNTTVTSEHLKKLEKELIQLINFWEKNLLFEGALVSVYYKTVIAKSNRIKAYMKGKSSSSNDSIVGARFDDENNNKHIITHLVDLNTLRNDVKNLKIVIKIVNERFNGEIDYNIINQVNSKEILIENISKTKFTQYIIDSYYIEKFDVYYNIEFQDKNS